MNEIKVIVNFKNKQCRTYAHELTSGDYNSTKLKFEFDVNEGRKVFEMKSPNGELVLVTDIKNNEVILAGKDEEGNNTSLFKQEGRYVFEISLYNKDGKLSSASAYLNVKAEAVVVDGEVVTQYLPIFDKLINEVENLNIEMENGVVTITRKDGSQYSENVNGDDYIITDEDYEEIETHVKEDIQPVIDDIANTSENALEVAETAESIARGKSQAIVFETFADLEVWLKDEANKGVGLIGDNLYIKQMWIDEEANIRQPDYWITEVLEEPNELGYYYNISDLGVEHPDLTNVVKNTDYATSTEIGIMQMGTGLYNAGNGKANVNFAAKSEIDSRKANTVIGCQTLDYAVGSVLPVMTQEEYDALKTKNENLYYFIVEE